MIDTKGDPKPRTTMHRGGCHCAEMVAGRRRRKEVGNIVVLPESCSPRQMGNILSTNRSCSACIAVSYKMAMRAFQVSWSLAWSCRSQSWLGAMQAA
eukprot:2187527-Amphidinium_carterae.1